MLDRRSLRGLLFAPQMHKSFGLPERNERRLLSSSVGCPLHSLLCTCIAAIALAHNHKNGVYRIVHPCLLRVHVPKDQSLWNLPDSDLDETWSAGSAGPKTSVECHFWDIRTRTVGLGGSEGPKYDLFLERFFGKNFFHPIAEK